MALVATLKTDEQRQEQKKTEGRKGFVAKPDGDASPENVTERKEVVPPLSIYEKMRGKPYSAEYFKIDVWDELTDELDIDGLKGKARTVDEWIREKIKREKLEDNVDTYKTVLEQYKDELNIHKTLRNDEKLDRIVKYIALLKKQRKLDERKRELLGL